MRMASVGVTLLVGIWLVMLAAACQEGEEAATATRTATATATASPTGSSTPDTASGVLSTCPLFSEGRSDATIIASGILSRGSQELLFDSQEFAALSEELERVLGLIRNAYPAVESIHAHDRYVAGQVVLGVEPPLEKAIQDAVASQPGATGLVTGQTAFDALNAQLGGVRGLHTEGLQEYGYLLLCLDELVNVRPASVAYSELEGVRNASPNQLMGDGPDIDALRDGNTWYVVFRDAWGDCPMGCIYEELTFFTVAGDEVTAVEPAQAAVDPKFASLARWVHGHEIVGIGVYWEQNPVTGEFVIMSPLVDSPAQRAGVRPGDVILAFDGESTSGWTEDDFRARLGGYEGTEVTLGVRHTDGSVEDISFVRGAVHYPMAVQAERIGVELAAGTPTGVLLVSTNPNFRDDPAVIRPGDLLLAVNGESTAGWTATEAADRIDSIPGEQVTITLRHIDGAVEDITVRTRSEICPTVPVAIYKGVVYLNGDVAPAGATVSAVQGGTALMTAIVGDGGRYELPLVRDIPPCLSDDPVFFRWEGHGAVSWDDLIADESVVDLSPGPKELNLTFESPPTLTPTSDHAVQD
jgi:membrane-associated protease RseP (regulator of RpoE activity)